MLLVYVCTNYNNSKFTVEATNSLLSNETSFQLQVVVVDNNSDVADLENLKSLESSHNNVHVIYSAINLGYFKGLNLGIKYSINNFNNIDYFIVGNNDLFFPAGICNAILNARDVIDKYAVIAPNITTMDGVHQNPHVAKSISPFRELIYDIYYFRCFLAKAILFIANVTRSFTDRKDELSFNVAAEINQGHGSCYILTPVFFKHFDDLFAPTFLMGEEFFLSYQLRTKKLITYYEPSISVTHYCKMSTGKIPKKQTWKYAKAAHRLNKNFKKNDKLPVNYQICSNCVMDTLDCNITFDESGVCDHCNGFKTDVLPHWYPNEEGKSIFRTQVEQIKKSGKGKPFDCILGMSGGMDSSYLLHLAVTEFNLRPLVFHVDGGWNTDIAVNNIQLLIDKLGLDLYTEVINWEEMKDFQLAFFKSGVPHLDIPQDHAFIATLYHFANKHNIKYILNGGNFATECVRNPKEWLYYGTDMAQLRDIQQQFCTRPLDTYPFSNILFHKVYLRYLKRVQVVKPLNYLPYTKEIAAKVLSETYGWRPYPQKHFESRFTCFYEGYWLPTRFGFDTRRVQFSSLILTGQMTRSDALQKLEKPAYNPDTIDEDFEYIATKLGISVDELRQYHTMPLKTFRDYKNLEWMFDIGAKLFHTLGIERSVKR